MVSRGIALLFLGTRHTKWRWGVSPTLRPPLPPGNTRYPFYRRLGGPQGRSGRAENFDLTGIRIRIVQLLVSRKEMCQNIKLLQIMVSMYNVSVKNYKSLFT